MLAEHAWLWAALALVAVAVASNVWELLEQEEGKLVDKDIVTMPCALEQRYMDALHRAVKAPNGEGLVNEIAELSKLKNKLHTTVQASGGALGEVERTRAYMLINGLDMIEEKVGDLKALVEEGATTETLQTEAIYMMHMSHLTFLEDLDTIGLGVAQMWLGWKKQVFEQIDRWNWTQDPSKNAKGLLETKLEEIQAMTGRLGLRMPGKDFLALEDGYKCMLTRDMSAGQLNTLIEQCWDYEAVDDLTNCRIAYFTGNYGEDKRLEMLDEALGQDFEYLFAAMSHDAYVPRTPKVVERLERSISVFPGLKQQVLLTLHLLGYPTTAWHLDSSDDDVEFLKNLITTRDIKSTIEAYKEEVLALYSREVLQMLLGRGWLATEDMCQMELYHRMCGRGDLEYLQWAKENCVALKPDDECVDLAVSGGHGDVLKFIEGELGKRVVPSRRAVNEAAGNGKLKLLVERCAEWKRFPGQDGVDRAAVGGHMDILKWLAREQRLPSNQDASYWAARNGDLGFLEWLGEERGVYPDRWGAYHAAENGHLKVLKWLVALPEEHTVDPKTLWAVVAARYGHWEVLEWLATETNIDWDQSVADSAAEGGDVEMLDWLAEKRCYPGQTGADRAAEHGHLNVLEWLASRSEPHQVHVSLQGANGAAKRGRLPILIWLAAAQRVYPTHVGANEAAGGGYLEVLEWLAREQKISPNEDGVAYAAENGHFKVLEWLVDREIYPTRKSADYAARSGRLDVLKWLARGQVYPTPWGAEYAADKGRLKVLEWLSKRPGVEFSVHLADNAAANGHLNVLKWVAREQKVYPSIQGVRGAAGNGFLSVLKWLADNQKLCLTRFEADVAAQWGQLDVLEWLGETWDIYPTQCGVCWAARDGRLEVLQWLATLPEGKQIVLDCEKANFAARNGHLEILQWLATLPTRVYPDCNGANAAVWRGDLRVLRWLATHAGIYPNQECFIHEVRVNRSKVLKWLGEQGIYPSEAA